MGLGVWVSVTARRKTPFLRGAAMILTATAGLIRWQPLVLRTRKHSCEEDRTDDG